MNSTPIADDEASLVEIKLTPKTLSEEIKHSANECGSFMKLVRDHIDRESIPVKSTYRTGTDWTFKVRLDDLSAVNAIIQKAIMNRLEPSWHDPSELDLAIAKLNARVGKSGETWWGDGFSGVDSVAMTYAGWLIRRQYLSDAKEFIRRQSKGCDVDISDADFRAIAADAFDLAERENGQWYCRTSRTFRVLTANAVTRAGKLLRTGEHYEAFKWLSTQSAQEDTSTTRGKASAEPTCPGSPGLHCAR